MLFNYTSLRHYANQLPKFLTKQLPFSQHPIISKTALFERLLLDTQRYGKEGLQKLSASDWPELTLLVHPSVQLYQWQ